LYLTVIEHKRLYVLGFGTVSIMLFNAILYISTLIEKMEWSITKLLIVIIALPILLYALIFTGTLLLIATHGDGSE